MDLDFKIKKIIKYISLYLVIYLTLKFVPLNKMTEEENIIISMICTTFYAFLETYFPTIYINKFVL